jgi:hypothetical protein
MHLDNLHFCGLSFRLLKPNAQKCRLFQRKITFLGHVISADGIAADPKKEGISIVMTKAKKCDRIKINCRLMFILSCSYASIRGGGTSST